MKRHTAAHRRSALWIAAMVHRVSGVALAAFLPLHFLALGLALESEARLDGFLTWSAQPIVKFTETGLVFLLAVHLLGGLRILIIENVAWHPAQKRLAIAAAALSAALALAFYVGSGAQ